MALTKVTFSMIEGAVANVLDYGADASGATDTTTAIQAALNSGVGVVYLPAGTYTVSSLTVPTGVTILGEGSNNTLIRTNSATANVVSLGVSGEIKNIKIGTSITRTTGFYVNVTGNGCLIESCEFVDYYIGVSLGVIGQPVVVNPRIFNCAFRSINTALGSGAIQLLNFSNAQVSNCVITGTDISSIQPNFGIKVQNGDTAFITDCNVTLHGIALLVNTPVSLNCYALTVTSCVFDSAHQTFGGVAVSSAEIGAAGNVFNTRFTNCWFGLSTTKNGCIMQTSGLGQVDGIVFTGCEFTDNGENGLIAVGSRVKNWVVTGGHSSGNAVAGIRCAQGTTNFIICGHRAGAIAGRGANDVGITLDNAAQANFNISSNNLVANTTAALVDLSTGLVGEIYNNTGYNNYSPPASLTVGASPWSYQASNAPEQIYISGGTVTQIEVSSVIIATTGPSILTLAPSETMTITYSSLPTVLTKIV